MTICAAIVAILGVKYLRFSSLIYGVEEYSMKKTSDMNLRGAYSSGKFEIERL